MTVRALWKGVITFESVAIPVKLFSGIQDTAVHFRLLHDRDKAPVKQMMVESESGEEVPAHVVRKGAPVAPGRFVVLTAADLAAVEPDDSRTIEIAHFVPAGALDHAFYDRPYWLGPDGRDDGDYWALVETLRGEGREGLARWVMRKRAYTGALRVRDDHLVLITTRHLGEVVERSEIKVPRARPPAAKELDMARQLVGMLEGSFDPTEYRDEYRDRVLALVQRKARGEKIAVRRPSAKRATSSLTAALQKSLAAASRSAPPRERRWASHG